jgi:hypothetical protein
MIVAIMTIFGTAVGEFANPEANEVARGLNVKPHLLDLVSAHMAAKANGD